MGSTDGSRLKAEVAALVGGRRKPTQCCPFSVDQPIDSEHRLADIVACYEQQAILRNATHFSTRLSEEAADAPCKDLSKPGQLGAGRRFHPAEPQRAVRTLDVNPVEEQHVEVDVEVERTAEALDQRDRAGLGRLTREPPPS